MLNRCCKYSRTRHKLSRSELRKSLLKAIGRSFKRPFLRQVFPLRMGALPGGAVEYAAFMDAEAADAAEASELADWLFGKRQFPRLDGVDTELLGCEV